MSISRKQPDAEQICFCGKWTRTVKRLGWVHVTFPVHCHSTLGVGSVALCWSVR